MILSFGNSGTEDIFNGQPSKASRSVLPINLHGLAKRKLNMLAVATQLIDLRVPPANRLEKLGGRWSGYYSIRINDQWRIVFKWSTSHAETVQIVDYH